MNPVAGPRRVALGWPTGIRARRSVHIRPHRYGRASRRALHSQHRQKLLPNGDRLKGMQDRPRSLRERAVLDERLAQLDEPHVEPLNKWVRQLRTRLGDQAIVPWFDPADAGIAASILWLLEAPGPKATRERGGSGIISCNNNDATAENAWRTRTEAGVTRDLVVHWNVIPYYLGDSAKIRAWDTTDLTAAGPLLRELLSFMPKVRCVILGGGAAQTAWRNHGASLAGQIIECPHPSPTNINTRPAARTRIVEAWRQAKAAVL
jgi:hypothetical protein